MPLGPELVGVREGRFDLAGSPVPIVGANNYYLAFASPAMRGSVIAAAKEFGFNTLRAWAFLDCRAPQPGAIPVDAWHGTYFQAGNPGGEGFFAHGQGDLYDGGRGVDCEAFLRIPEIDFGTFHLYPQSWNQKDPIMFGMRWIEEHLAAGEKAGKPMLMEEYGMTVWENGLPSGLPRDYIYRCWLQTILSKKGAGDLAWMIAGADDPPGRVYQDFDHFTVYGPGEVMSIRDHVLQMTEGAPASELPSIRVPGAGEAIVHLWVTDQSGIFLDENPTRVVLKRNGDPLGDPLHLDFSSGAPQLTIPVFPLGEMQFEITPSKYEPCTSGLFQPEEHQRLFLHVTTTQRHR
jgi:hypothetical protein